MRACGSPLERRETTWVCSRGHSFDIARAGYVNLLQPQDRRSASPGDAREAVLARRRLHAQGLASTVTTAVVSLAVAAGIDADAMVVDLGCGTGDALAALAARGYPRAVGIDLSTTAIAAAARRFPDLTWIVANADRHLPLLDGSVALVLSVNARRNPAECARVVPLGGHLLVVIPAADDLIELRERVQGHGVSRERAEAVVAEHGPCFELRERVTVRERHSLAREALLDLLRGTYRGERASAAERIAALDTLEVTLASDVLRFRRR